MGAVKRTCRVLGCTNRLRPGLLMCPNCWRTIPRAERKRCREAFARDPREGAAIARDLLAEAARYLAPLLPPEGA